MTAIGGNSSAQLKTLVERIERLEDEKKGTLDDIKDIYKEAKGNGFDPKILRKVVALRKVELAARQETEALIDLYMNTIDGV